MFQGYGSILYHIVRQSNILFYYLILVSSAFVSGNLRFEPYLRVGPRSWKIDSFKEVQVIMYSQRAPCGKLNSKVWHFGVREQRSAEQALLLLQERIDMALRARNMVSLMSLHVKGTYCEISSKG